MKKCFKCGAYKALTLFYKHPQMGDGHLNKCKACTKNDNQQNFWKNRDYYRKYDKERFQTSERKAKTYRYNKLRRIRHPGKARARNAVLNAIRDGKLIRQPCSVCKIPNAQAHHIDYRSPLKIKWLCFVHHRQAHGQLQNQ
jgi:hypothetical protein